MTTQQKSSRPTTPPKARAGHVNGNPQPQSSTDRGPVTGLLAALRIGVGFIFVWAFLDKAFGLGYSTPTERAWLDGGSPTEGFLGNVSVGPFQGMFNAMSGSVIADWLFMLGLLGIGLAALLGIGLRIAAVGGTILMLAMWAAVWPMAQFTSAGEPTMSTNPVVTYHLLYAVILILAATTAAGSTFGLGRVWAKAPVVRDNAWLR